MFDTVKDVFVNFRSIIKKMHKIADRELAVYGISHIELRALMMIYQSEPGCSQEELSSKFDMDRSNVGRALKKLENFGCIAREKDEADGRMYRVYLLAKGLEIKDTLFEVQRNLRKTFVSAISEPEFLELKKILDRVDSSITYENYLGIKNKKQ